MAHRVWAGMAGAAEARDETKLRNCLEENKRDAFGCAINAKLFMVLRSLKGIYLESHVDDVDGDASQPRGDCHVKKTRRAGERVPFRSIRQYLRRSVL
jgi:hypothetical protein